MRYEVGTQIRKQGRMWEGGRCRKKREIRVGEAQTSIQCTNPPNRPSHCVLRLATMSTHPSCIIHINLLKFLVPVTRRSCMAGQLFIN